MIYFFLISEKKLKTFHIGTVFHQVQIPLQKYKKFFFAPMIWEKIILKSYNIFVSASYPEMRVDQIGIELAVLLSWFLERPI